MKTKLAFPQPFDGAESGMTLRDFFAAHVMGGLCSGETFDFDEDGENDEGNQEWAEDNAKFSYKLADAMMKAREASE